jgi:hypothetical protein
MPDQANGPVAEIRLVAAAVLQLLLGRGADRRAMPARECSYLAGTGLDGALLGTAALAHLRSLGYIHVAVDRGEISVSLTSAGVRAAQACARDLSTPLLQESDFDRLLEQTLVPPKPSGFAAVVGQAPAKARLFPQVDLLHRTGRPFPNTMLIGPPGIGKTHMATAIADECGWPLLTLSCPDVERTQLGWLFRPGSPRILFFDELHATRRTVRDALLRRIDPSAHGSHLVIAATSQPGDVRSDLARRFQIQIRLTAYSTREAACLTSQLLELHGVRATDPAARIMARAARGRPDRLTQLSSGGGRSRDHRPASAHRFRDTTPARLSKNQRSSLHRSSWTSLGNGYGFTVTCHMPKRFADRLLDLRSRQTSAHTCQPSV